MIGVALVGALAACGPPPPITTGMTGAPAGTSAAPHEPGIAEITDEAGRLYKIAQGRPGEPAVVGCADGQREAFVDATAPAGVAGCIGEWPGQASLRASPTGVACGDDLGPCGAPADACAPGWHLCGASGGIGEVSAIGADACERAGGGRFVAAISHCETQSGCETDDAATGDYACFERGWCSEPVCCGDDCRELGVCQSGVWPGRTHIPVGIDQGCGAIGSSRARGVLCCRDQAGAGASAGGAVAPPLANPTLQAAAESAAFDQVRAMLAANPPAAAARAALRGLVEPVAGATPTADLERELRQLQQRTGDGLDGAARAAAFDEVWRRHAAEAAGRRAAAGLTTSVPVGGEVSIRDCVRDGQRPGAGGEVSIRDCVRGADYVTRLLATAGAEHAMLGAGGGVVLSDPEPAPEQPPGLTRTRLTAPFFYAADDHGRPSADRSGRVSLPLVSLVFAGDRQDWAGVQGDKVLIPRGHRAVTIQARFRIDDGSAFALALGGYASAGFALRVGATSRSDRGWATVCEEERVFGAYAPVFASASVRTPMIGQSELMLTCSRVLPGDDGLAIVPSAVVAQWATVGGLGGANNTGAQATILELVVTSTP